MKFKRGVMFILFFALIFALSPVEFALADYESVGKINALKQERSSLEAENNSLKKELWQAQEDLAELQKKLEQNQRELKNARADLAKSQLKGNAPKKKTASQINKINKLESENNKLNEAIRRERSKVSEQNVQINKLERRIAELEAKIKELNDMPGGDEAAWHPKATSQIVKWDFKPGDRAVKLTILYKNSGKTQQVLAEKHGRDPEREDVYFLVSKLPQGLQAVLPDGWTVNVDKRKDYVKMILNPDDIEHSKLSDADSGENDHREGSGKTFTSGEAIILNKQGGMTIRPPVL